ncbi:C2 domain [Dillenia turbinata]|uniref:C2 domain n=1 Tax=Dillenia turbinata TaxID=194707 RepID=A0AAN8ZGF6_9MAGN
MASRQEVEVTISSAKDLKNVNWRHGDLKPYAVLWVDPKNKCSTKVDERGDTSPHWDEPLVIPLTAPPEDSTLYIDIVHAYPEEGTKPLIGSAKLPLREVVCDVGFGEPLEKTLKLKRPSGRPQGKLEVKVVVRETRHRAPDPYYAPPYGVQQREYSGAPPAYGNPYAAAAPPAGYPYSAQGGYGQPSYGYGQPAYVQSVQGQDPYGSGRGLVQEEKKKSKFGMGTGLAVGAAAGLLGGLAIAEGVDYVEDKITDEAAERVEEDLGYDGDDF